MAKSDRVLTPKGFKSLMHECKSECSDSKIKRVSRGQSPARMCNKYHTASFVREIKDLQEQSKSIEESTLTHIFEAIYSSFSSLEKKISASQNLVQMCDSVEEQIITLQSQDALRRIISLISFHNESVQINALKSVVCLSRNPEVAKLLIENDILSPFKQMLNTSNTRLLLPLLHALAALAEYPDVQALMGQRGFVPRLLKLCQSKDADVVLASTQLLGALARTDAICPQIIFYGGFEPLARSAQRPDAPPALREASRRLLDSLVHLHEATQAEPAMRRVVRKAPPALHGPGAGHGPDVHFRVDASG